ncbi:Ran GAP Rna1 [Rhizina undulata]
MSSSKIFVLKSTDGKPLKFDTAEDLEPYIAALKSSTNFEEIHLGGNTLGISACEALSPLLSLQKNLKVFNAADIFTGRLITEIPAALTALLTPLLTLEHLHTVDLSDNAFGGRLADPLKEFYSRAGPLRHLLLNNNGLGPAGGEIVAGAIKDLAGLKASDAKYPPLETIVCGRNRLENGSMKAWAEAYAAHKSLKTVRMVQNGIRQEGIDTLLRKGLKHCLGLETLDLQDNTFTERGASALSAAVTGWEGLKELGVGDCLLSAKGGVLLAEALAEGKNRILETLKLQYNEIDVKGLKALLTATHKALPKLERIELNGNKFSEEDPSVDALRDLFLQRGFGELDSLSDMEEESEEEEEEEVYDEEKEEEEMKILQVKDKKVEDLADLLDEAKI